MANANPTVQELIRERLRSTPGGILPWSEVMRMALYEPGSGYYRQGVRRIGRGGDFFTSVSVGTLYGALLAECCLQVWQALGKPREFAILEQGANDGTLAADVLDALQASHPELAAFVQYVIIEPDEAHRRVQKERLGERVTHVTDWAELGETPLHGLLVCNELLDAFPVHRVRFTGGRWQELGVEMAGEGELQFAPVETDNRSLRNELALLGDDHPEGRVMELNLAMLGWMRQVAEVPFCGAVLVADYGYASEPDEPPGLGRDTLRRYHQHRSDGKVLEELGACDLTAHVNFTRLSQAAEATGLGIAEFIEQGRYLTRLAATIMQHPGFQPDAQWMRQFQTLTHPGHLGHSFQMLLMAKGIPATALNSLPNIEAARRRLCLPPGA